MWAPTHAYFLAAHTKVLEYLKLYKAICSIIQEQVGLPTKKKQLINSENALAKYVLALIQCLILVHLILEKNQRFEWLLGAIDYFTKISIQKIKCVNFKSAVIKYKLTWD